MISTASSESSSRTASAICSFGIDSRISLRTVSSTSVSATQSKSLPMRRTSWSRSSGIERLQHVAEVGFVQIGDERAQRRAVVPLDGVGDALDEFRAERAVLVADGVAAVRLRSCGRLCLPPRILRATRRRPRDRLARGVFQEKAAGIRRRNGGTVERSPLEAGLPGRELRDRVRLSAFLAASTRQPQRASARRRLVRSRGLEPPRVAPQRPQRCASTSSATTA